MLILSLVIILVILILMILRFVYPELIYSLRQASVEVDIGRAILDFDMNRSGASERLNFAQIKDIRFETTSVDEDYIGARICNIKKLYHLSGPRRHVSGSNSHDVGKPQLCIIELANLLSNYGKHIVPDAGLKYPLCVAEDILTLIANEILQKQKKSSRITKDTVQDWFEKHPMSVEQVLELLSSALYALSYRHRSQKNSQEKADQDNQS